VTTPYLEPSPGNNTSESAIYKKRLTVSPSLKRKTPFVWPNADFSVPCHSAANGSLNNLVIDGLE
jgi:hypothetical protein